MFCAVSAAATREVAPAEHCEPVRTQPMDETVHFCRNCVRQGSLKKTVLNVSREKIDPKEKREKTV